MPIYLNNYRSPAYIGGAFGNATGAGFAKGVDNYFEDERYKKREEEAYQRELLRKQKEREELGAIFGEWFGNQPSQRGLTEIIAPTVPASEMFNKPIENAGAFALADPNKQTADTLLPVSTTSGVQPAFVWKDNNNFSSPQGALTDIANPNINGSQQQSLQRLKQMALKGYITPAQYLETEYNLTNKQPVEPKLHKYFDPKTKREMGQYYHWIGNSMRPAGEPFVVNEKEAKEPKAPSYHYEKSTPYQDAQGNWVQDVHVYSDGKYTGKQTMASSDPSKAAKPNDKAAAAEKSLASLEQNYKRIKELYKPEWVGLDPYNILPQSGNFLRGENELEFRQLVNETLAKQIKETFGNIRNPVERERYKDFILNIGMTSKDFDVALKRLGDQIEMMKKNPEMFAQENAEKEAAEDEYSFLTGW